jgi:hypothetical protein
LHRIKEDRIHHSSKGGEIKMSIQPVSNSNPYSAVNADFQTLQSDIQAVENPTSTAGTQDQVSLSQDALQKALTQFQNDLASLEQGSPGTQGTQAHHHHHHHKMFTATAGGSDTSGGASSTLATTTSSVNLTA